MLMYDALVIGSGPNGLAAAVTLARQGWRVGVFERNATIGGGTRTEERTLPGFHHDVCAAVHPMAVASPFLRSLPLHEHGLEWVWPEVQMAHPLDDGSAVASYRDLDRTAENLGREGPAYRDFFAPLVASARALVDGALTPLTWPKHPLLLARFGWQARRSATALVRRSFVGPRTAALFAGNAAHGVLPLDQPFSAAVGMMLCIVAHAEGWPIARGGSASITQALARYLQTLGGEIHVGQEVKTLRDLPPARVVLADVSPRGLAQIAGDVLPTSYRKRLLRYRHGPAAFKMDWALAGPIPWTAPECRLAGTVHLGGTIEEVTAAEHAPWHGRVASKPFVLLAQQSIIDPTRAPAGQHTGWAYCHVPNGDATDMTDAIEAQVERFAPGFRELILQRAVTRPADFEQYNPNYVGGDVVGGAQDWRQLITRPVVSLNPCATPHPRVFLCSASTPPGGGVHGMCGYLAAQAVLRRRMPAVAAFE
ncbi:MAG TPA: NAD(P)/FAD-dependent oxidoreductase [Candidatus Synoicihabitans sp.]|nr:NAD(P)/FAD-dependent oxidoreductase [Candidatus Synoicihabitans sp.]